MNQHSGNTQFGGTLLGLILGLVVGLGTALAVALYVTKAPVPFMDRGSQRPSTTEALEAERSRDWNPNQSLSTGTPGLTPIDPVLPITPGGRALPSLDGTSGAAGDSTDAIGQLIQGVPSSSTTVTTVEVPDIPDPFVYYVQAGAYRTADDANTHRARLAMAGFESQIMEREQAGQTVHRVRMGPYDSRPQAEAAEQRLRAQGFDTALVRAQR